MASTASTRFARLFAGEPGIDPYTRAVSDVFQDVFGEGSFIGKGIYDVDVLSQSLAGRLPDNRVLSHDLLEGAFGRAGLVSDVVLVEDIPSAPRRRGEPAAIAGSAATGRSPAWLRRRVPSGGDGWRTRCRSCRAGRSSTTCAAASCRLRCWRSCSSAGRARMRRCVRDARGDRAAGFAGHARGGDVDGAPADELRRLRRTCATRGARGAAGNAGVTSLRWRRCRMMRCARWMRSRARCSDCW